MKAILLLAAGLVMAGRSGAAEAGPFRFGMVGLVHDHAGLFIGDTRHRRDVELAGIVEPNHELVARYEKAYGLKPALFFDTLAEMLDRTHVRAVAVCSSTFGHREIVEACAARGVDVMMEKPLAVNMAHARAIAAAARRSGIRVVVNYETSWYPTTQEARRLVGDERAIGELRKIVVRDGHEGPKEIGASKEFLAWLTDPVLDGGGALMDFGCYGADLITWLMGGQRPVAVTAVTQTIKPEVYPKVDDEATIVLSYPHAQGIIEASWNWPFGRKDMDVYGRTGYILAPNRSELRVRRRDMAEAAAAAPVLTGARADPLTYFAAVARREIEPDGLSSLETNLIVTEILDAARESARTGRRVELAAEAK
ncbi:MAG TPA: Gfo/Idh/MocA family oxidoreductase [Opitutus sp.]|nr:Gfo/Idh/MocA family oxidoreductase [Opitutus sp.]